MNSIVYTKNGVNYTIHSARLNYYTPDEIVEEMWRGKAERIFWEKVAAKLSKEEKATLFEEAKTEVKKERSRKEQTGAEILVSDSV